MVTCHDGREFQLSRTPTQRPRQLANHAQRSLLMILVTFGSADVMHEGRRLQYFPRIRFGMLHDTGFGQPVVQVKRELGYALGMQKIGIQISCPYPQTAHGGSA